MKQCWKLLGKGHFSLLAFDISWVRGQIMHVKLSAMQKRKFKELISGNEGNPWRERGIKLRLCSVLFLKLNAMY